MVTCLNRIRSLLPRAICVFIGYDRHIKELILHRNIHDLLLRIKPLPTDQCYCKERVRTEFFSYRNFKQACMPGKFNHLIRSQVSSFYGHNSPNMVKSCVHKDFRRVPYLIDVFVSNDLYFRAAVTRPPACVTGYPNVHFLYYVIPSRIRS